MLSVIGKNNRIEARGEIRVAIKEAIRLYHEHHPDIILMDIKMPIMDGLEATREIRKENVNIPIIALTANAFDSDKQKSLDVGCNDYMTKPIIASELLELMNRYI